MTFLKDIFGRRRPSAEDQALQMMKIGQDLAQFLSVSLFKLCVDFVEARYPGRRAEAIGAHMKLACTGEGLNEKSVASSTPEDRELAEALATDVMSTNAKGFYWLPIYTMPDHVNSLSCTAESIKSLALTAARQIALAHLSSAADLSHGMNQPIINRDYVRTYALPLLLRVERYESDNAVVQTDIAQTYFSLFDIEKGVAAATKAAKLDPKNAEALRLVGNGHMMMGQDIEARKCFEKALALDPMLEGARQALKLLRV